MKVPQAVSAGAYHSLFLRKDGVVWAWGQNVSGQLGTGSTSSTPLSQPSRVDGLPAIKAVAAGIAHSLALDVDGNVWAWGQNASGQAGLGTVGGTVLVPTRIAALSAIQAIAANGNFSLALGTDGRLWAWGQNASGQVGTGSASAAVATPGVVQGLPPVRAMAAGVNHGLALATDGKVWGWGLNTSAQVGTGATSAAVLAPVQVGGLPRAKAVAAGAGHSLIVDEQFGNVWAWGQNTFGQVGTGSISSTPVMTPVPVNGVFAVTAIVAGHNSSMALIGNGQAVAWGHNVSGQLGNGGTANSASPVGVTGLSNATALAAGAQHALALRPGCPVWAWGNNGQGQLGTGTTSSAPVTSPGTALIVNTFYFDGDMDGFGDAFIAEQTCEPSPGFVEEIDCDDYSATTHPGAPEACNGADDNCDGTVDDGNPSGGENCPTGKQGVCAVGMTVCAHGSLECQQRQVASPEQCDGLDNDCDGSTDEGNPGALQACVTGQQGVCGAGVTFCTGGALQCVQTQGASSEVCDGKDNDCDGQPDNGLTAQKWYRDQDGDNYGLASQFVQDCTRPAGYAANAGDCNDAQPGLNPGVTEVCDGVDNDCDGLVDEGFPNQTWYRDADGDGFGDASKSTQGCQQPSQACQLLTNYVLTAGDCNDINAGIRPGATEVCDGVDNNCNGSTDEMACSGPRVAVGESHSLALKADGTVWAWGRNDAGQLGDGTTIQRNTPVKVLGLTGVMAIAAGASASLALKTDGTVWAWGSNYNGHLGGGAVSSLYMPAQVLGLTGVAAIAVGTSQVFALKQDGTVWAWGLNTYGQLGDGTTTFRYFPTKVQSLTGVAAIAPGDHHSLALKKDGTVWAWGENLYGQLGDGTTTDHSTPAQVQGLPSAKALATRGNHSVVLTSDGAVWAWGDNNWGQLGDGTYNNRSTPAQIQSLTGVGVVSAGMTFTLAAKTNSVVYALGNNNNGQLGIGNSSIPRTSSPAILAGITAVETIAASSGHIVALRADGTFWAWGINSFGQLGDGTTTNRIAPVQVQGLGN
ncbi:MopE-related protein [Corallococcus caeni]|uniref:RCC1 domain-containing protein n=1 Tax=Corallococcus caeni TaxID=3082388 RepID=UPI0030C6CFC6